MKIVKRYAIDMCTGPIASKVIRFALPLMAANIIQLLFNAADVVVVGKFVGDNSQAAVTSTGPLINLIVGLFMGLSVGVNVMVARALGSRDQGRISAVVHTSVTVGAVGGLVMVAIGEVAAPLLLRLMGSPDGVIGLSTLYLRVYFLGLPGDAVYNFGSALLRARGDTKRPMYFLTLSGAVNVILNLVFVVNFHWDVAGVAAATAISKYIAAGLVLYCLHQESDAMQLDLHQLRVDWDLLKKIARIGLPAGLQGCLFSLSNVTIQSSINSMGEVVMAGAGAVANIGGFIYVTGNAFYQAAMTFTSQNYGAGKTERVDRVYGWCALFGVLFPLVSGVTVWLLGPQVLSIYTNEPEVVEQGMIRISMVTVFYFMSGFMEVSSGVLRGLGYSLLPMLVTLVGTCGMRMGWALMVFPMFCTPQSLYICLPLSWAVTGVAHLLSFVLVRRRTYDKAPKGLQSAALGKE